MKKKLKGHYLEVLFAIVFIAILMLYMPWGIDSKRISKQVTLKIDIADQFNFGTSLLISKNGYNNYQTNSYLKLNGSFKANNITSINFVLFEKKDKAKFIKDFEILNLEDIDGSSVQFVHSEYSMGSWNFAVSDSNNLNYSSDVVSARDYLLLGEDGSTYVSAGKKTQYNILSSAKSVSNDLEMAMIAIYNDNTHSELSYYQVNASIINIG